MIVSDALADPRFAASPLVTGDPHIRFYAGAPLKTPDGFNLGTFCVIDRKPRILSEGHRKLLADLSVLVMEELELRSAAQQALVELAAEQKQANESLRLAQTDSLTGCFNRRGFAAMARREFARAHRHDRPLSLLMLDIDHFKSINDTHGHCVGDEVLKAMVETTESCMRPPDILGRFGGEEFVVLAPETPIGGALSLANRLLDALAETEVRTSSDVLRFTVSIGVTDCDSRSGALDGALGRADSALYQAKAGGKNMVRAENRPGV